MCGSVSLYGLCISSYYGKYEVFDLQVTLDLDILPSNDLELGEGFTTRRYCKIIHYEHFEVFYLFIYLFTVIYIAHFP